MVSRSRKIELPATPEWSDFLTKFGEKSIKERSLDGVVYEVVKRHGVHMLAMHRPIKTEFLTELDESKGEFFDHVPEKSPTRFANSTAVAFLEPGVTVAICKAQQQASPGKEQLERFLEEFVLSHSGEQVRWVLSPLKIEGRRDELKQSSRGVTWYKTRFKTHNSLFSEQHNGLHSLMAEVADLLRSDLNIDIEIKIPRDNRSMKTERALKEYILRDLDETAQQGSGAKVKAISPSGEAEIMNLVAEKLTVEFDMPPEATERQSFSDLTAGLHRVLVELQEHINDAHK